MKNLLSTILLGLSVTITSAQIEFVVINTPTENNFIASSFINDDEGWIADNQSVLWHTNNGMATFDTMFIGKQFVKIDFIDASNGFAIGNDIAYKTSDGGATWQSLSLEHITSALLLIDKNTGFISGVDSIYKTNDNGISWSTIPIEQRTFVDYYFTDESTGIAAAGNFTDNKPLWRTTDGGQTWKNVFDDYHYHMNSVFFLNKDTGWAAGYFETGGSTHEPSILKSTDGGSSWTMLYQNNEVMGLGESFIDIRFKSSLNGFAISNMFVNVITTDGGKTWTRADETDFVNFPEHNGYYKTIEGSNKLYLIGTGAI